MKNNKGLQLSCAFLLFFFWSSYLRADSILMFVAHEQTYYTEYVVMKEALEASGYEVDVRSASELDFSIYMSPYNDIPGVANDLEGSSYSEFQDQFEGLFGASWQADLNSIPEFANTNGRLLDIDNVDAYAGIVVVGGLGSLTYRVDGTYEAQGEEEREVSATTVQETAEYLNELAIEALLQGKPVMAQCHGSSIAAFWRIPDTNGPGEEALGYSLLKGEISAGYPESATSGTLQSLDVTYRPNDRVTIANAHSSLNSSYTATAKIITTRDWYPQTVAHAARTFLNVLETYPSEVRKETEISTLVIHGGALDPEDCGPGNKENDVPCNHGGGENLPADYTHLMDVLNANETHDDFNLVNDHLDLSTTELDLSDEEEVLSFLSDYDVIVFFKHWSTLITDDMQQAIVSFADNGGGVIGLHHALYNDLEGQQNKDVLVTELFGAESSPPPSWAANLTTFNMYATNHGHFISSYLIDYDNVADHPTVASWESDPLPATANTSFSTLPFISVYDELYVNFNYTGDIAIGRGLNELTPLFSNDAPPPVGSPTQTRQTGFTRLVDINDDGQIGKVAYMALGERTENIDAESTYGQMIRNAVVWSAPQFQKQSQTINFESVEDKTYLDQPFELVANSTSGLHVSFNIVEGLVSLDGSELTIEGVGTVVISATQEGNDEYHAAESETISFEVVKADQYFSYEELEDITAQTSSLLWEATASSELTVTYDVDGPTQYGAGSFTFSGESGIVTVDLFQAGNDFYNEASETITFNVIDEVKNIKKSLSPKLKTKHLGLTLFN